MSAITGVETEIFKSQIPGGMISNLVGQMREQGAERGRKGAVELGRRWARVVALGLQGAALATSQA